MGWVDNQGNMHYGTSPSGATGITNEPPPSGGGGGGSSPSTPPSGGAGGGPSGPSTPTTGPTSGVEGASSTPPTTANATPVSQSKVTLYSPHGGTITVDPSKVNELVGQGWSTTPSANPTKSYPTSSAEGATSTPPPNTTGGTPTASSKVTLYSPNGGTITVDSSRVNDLVGQGWSRTPASNPTKPYSTPTSGVEGVSSTPPSTANATPVSQSKVTLYSPNGGTITVDSSKVNDLVGQGWSRTPASNPTKPYATETTVSPIESVPTPVATTKVTLYSPNGGTITVDPSKVSSLVKDGWAEKPFTNPTKPYAIEPTVSEIPTAKVTLYSPNGGTITVAPDKVAGLEKDGWSKTQSASSKLGRPQGEGDSYTTEQIIDAIQHRGFTKADAAEVFGEQGANEITGILDRNIDVSVATTKLGKPKAEDGSYTVEQIYQAIKKNQFTQKDADMVFGRGNVDLKVVEQERILYKASLNAEDVLKYSDSPAEAIKILKDAGFSDKEIRDAAHKNLTAAEKASSDVAKKHSTWGTIKFAAGTTGKAALAMVPGVKEYEEIRKGNWTGLAIASGIDIATIFGPGVAMKALKEIRPAAEIIVPTVKGDVKIWKGVEVGGKQIVGKTPKGIKFGRPDVELSVREISPHYRPGSPGSTRVMTDIANLRKMGVPESEIVGKLQPSRELMSKLNGWKSPYTEKTLLTNPTKTLSGDGVTTVYKEFATTAKGLKDPSLLYGSRIGVEQQTKAELRHLVQAADLDVQLGANQAAAAKFAENLANKLKITEGVDRVRINPETPTLIETLDPATGKWAHAVDIHSKELVEGLESSAKYPALKATGEYSYGTRIAEKPVKFKVPGTKDTVHGMSMAEQGKRNVDSILGWMPVKEAPIEVQRMALPGQEFVFSPLEHRVKDVARAVLIAETRGESKLARQIAKAYGLSYEEILAGKFGAITPEIEAMAGTRIVVSPKAVVTGSGAVKVVKTATPVATKAAISRTASSGTGVKIKKSRGTEASPSITHKPSVSSPKVSTGSGRARIPEVEAPSPSPKPSSSKPSASGSGRAGSTSPGTTSGKRTTSGSAASGTSGSPKPGGPTPKPKTPSPKPGSPTPKPKTPSPKPGSPTPEPKTPSPKPGSPPPDYKPPSPKPPSPKPGSPPPGYPPSSQPTSPIIRTEKGVPILLVIPHKVSKDTTAVVLPSGSITWKMGLYWKYIPPPWNQIKPITLKQPPYGAVNTGGRTPKQTIQMIGKPGARVPKTASVHLGIVDILIDDYGRTIRFVSRETRNGTPTTGLSVPGGAVGLRRKARIIRPRKVKHKNKSNYHFVSTL